jgi:putative glutamine amidotransferase
MRPVIGITTRPRTVPTSGGDLGADSLQHTYRDSVVRAGGIPLPLSPVADADVPTLVDRIDGLLLTGGGDISPDAYGGRHHDAMYAIDETRDAFEFALTREARERRTPVLAVCRGLQVVNVALGGSLIEDIPTEVGSTDHAIRGPEVFNGHQRIRLDASCRIARLVGADTLLVNSIHHQAVRNLAPELRIVGRAEDGVVEALEPVDDSWPLLAVQWHPEYLSDAGDPASHALFAALVEAAATRAIVG